MTFSWKNLLLPLNWVTVITVVVLDQLTKWLVVQNIALGQHIDLLPFFDLVHTKNRGAAFGMFHEASAIFRLVFFALVTIVCLAILIRWLGTTNASERLLRFSLALILGGAFGNVFDRTVYGEVTDFVHVFWHQHHFPAFNIADSAITTGTTLLILQMLLLRRNKSLASHASKEKP